MYSDSKLSGKHHSVLINPNHVHSFSKHIDKIRRDASQSYNLSEQEAE